MRGKAPTFKDPEPPSRITPAYAGKSCPAVYGNRLAQDHPRVCGEKCRNPIIAQAEGGSPPRMRGKVPCVLFFGVGIGITPAYAGKSHSLFGTFGAARDHPRVCGEKRTQAHPAKTGLGSPPRMRGKETPDQGIDQEFGITPAYAGKSWAFDNYLELTKDHPRVCGEKQMERGAGRLWVGSPPRMRGKGVVCGCKRVLCGITPAYAGKSPRG